MSSVVFTRRSVLNSASLVNAGNEYEPRLSTQSASDEIDPGFVVVPCLECGTEYDCRDYEGCPKCLAEDGQRIDRAVHRKTVTTCLTCGHDLPVIESQAEADRRYATALAGGLRTLGDDCSALLVERLLRLSATKPQDVTRDCIDTIGDKLLETIDHTDGRLACFTAEIEMPVCDEFASAPLHVTAIKEGFAFEFKLKSVTTRSHWRSRDRKFWCLSYSVEMA